MQLWSVLLDGVNAKNECYYIIDHACADDRAEGKGVGAPALLQGKSLVIQEHCIMIQSILGDQSYFENQVYNIECLK